MSSCDQHTQIKSDLHALHTRVVSFIGTNEIPLNADLHLNPPQRSSMRIKVTELQINLREFYALEKCQLNKTVAERNTALGKTQLPSTRYAYEKALIAQLQSCLKLLPANHKMTPKLSEWLELKQGELPLVWANMITQSQEVYNAFAVTPDFIAGNDKDQLHAAKQALRYILVADDTYKLETHLKTLQDSRIFARMWRSQKLVTQYLQQMKPSLQTYLDTNQCKTRQDREAISIMRNIFRHFFAEKIQSTLSQLNHYHYQLNPLLTELSQKLAKRGDEASLLSNYINHHTQLSHNAYKEAVNEYIALWRSVFVHCD
ncbi:DUF3080 family protein [Agaribacter flavus]|uniref:DUF3080 family protein n=1 Tax=Agaribacter flavus TaxID=1902781 RepID=UPI0036732BA0